MPKVSILIPVYNTERYIAQTIESILNQTYQDWELVIVDDCSKDATYAICEEYAQKEPRIRLYRNEQNLGMMPNWNYGLSLCDKSAAYWGKLDADDIWHAQMLEDCVNVLDRMPDVGLVCTKHINIDENGQIIPNSESNPPDWAKDSVFDYGALVKIGSRMFQHNIARQGIGLMRRKIFEDLGVFTLLPAGDTEMWFRIGAHYQFYGINKIYHRHRIWSASFTRQEVLKVQKETQNLYDVRKAIFEYYHKHGKISTKEFQQFQKENQFELDKFRLYQFRTQKKWSSFFILLFQNVLTNPFPLFQFYFKRWRER